MDEYFNSATRNDDASTRLCTRLRVCIKVELRMYSVVLIRRDFVCIKPFQTRNRRDFAVWHFKPLSLAREKFSVNWNVSHNWYDNVDHNNSDHNNDPILNAFLRISIFKPFSSRQNNSIIL